MVQLRNLVSILYLLAVTVNVHIKEIHTVQTSSVNNAWHIFGIGLSVQSFSKCDKFMKLVICRK